MKSQYNKNELEVFSNELLNDFQMMETYAGVSNNCPKNGDCSVNIILCGVKFFCGSDCIFKFSQKCGAPPTPTPGDNGTS